MRYNYTAYYKTDEERIKAIAEDILREYPNLGNLAIDAAKLERPFGRVNEDYAQFSDDENHINRLIDIVMVTEGKPEFQEEYKKACENLLKSYSSWCRNFPYTNPEEQAVYLVMQKFSEHLENKEIPLITVNQATEQLEALDKEKELKMRADSLRNDFPILGEIADEVIKLEDERGILLENDIIRLVAIIKLIEDREDCEEIYSGVWELLEDKFSIWRENVIKRVMSEKQQMVIEKLKRLHAHYTIKWNASSKKQQMVAKMLSVLSAHSEDESIPILTYEETEEELSTQKKTKCKFIF